MNLVFDSYVSGCSKAVDAHANILCTSVILRLGMF